MTNISGSISSDLDLKHEQYVKCHTCTDQVINQGQTVVGLRRLNLNNQGCALRRLTGTPKAADLKSGAPSVSFMQKNKFF